MTPPAATGAASVVVVDASFAVPWVVQEPNTAAAVARRKAWAEAGVSRIAPALFAVETATALLKCVRRGAILPTAAPRSLAALLRAVTVIPDDEALSHRALAIAQQLGTTKAYDSLYCALAEREGGEFWTGDHRYVTLARPAFPFVHFVAEPP